MEIREIKEKKKQYLDLLLLGDEQESMIDRYLERGWMFLLDDGGVRAECVVTDEGEGVLEIKNIAVFPEYHRRGYGKKLVGFIEKEFKGRFLVLRAGTGDSPLTVPFYEKCGFQESFRIKDFFTDHYDHPIVEGGVTLSDMVYFEKRLDQRRGFFGSDL